MTHYDATMDADPPGSYTTAPRSRPKAKRGGKVDRKNGSGEVSRTGRMPSTPLTADRMLDTAVSLVRAWSMNVCAHARQRGGWERESVCVCVYVVRARECANTAPLFDMVAYR